MGRDSHKTTPEEVLPPAQHTRNGNTSEPATPEEESRRHAAEGDLRGLDGDFQGALKEYKKAAHLSPESSQYLSRIAEGYAANDQPYKAIEYYQRALQASQKNGGDQDLTEAHIGLGDLCCSFALSAAAIRSYERAVRSKPKKPFYRWKLAVALAALGLYEKAEQQLDVVLELSPRDAFYHFQMADLYLLMQRCDDAIASLKRVVELAPRDEYYRLRLGAALLRANYTAEAIPHFEKAWQMAPESESYRTLLQYAYSRNKEKPEIAVDVEILGLSAYDQDFVRRLQLLSQPDTDC